MKHTTVFISTCISIIMASCTNTSESPFIDGVTEALKNDGQQPDEEQL